MNYTNFRKQQKFLQLPEGKLAYTDQGSGPVILLVHGVPTSSWLYRKLIPSLVSKSLRVIAPDLLGYGSSDKPEGYEVYGSISQANRLLQLMEHLKIKKWIHVCHDAGGIWTWEMLRLGKSKVIKLILLNTIIYKQGFNPPVRFKKGFIARLYTGLYKNKIFAKIMMKATIKNGVRKGTALTNEMIEGYVLPMQEGGNRAIYNFFTHTCNELPDYHPLLKSLNIKTMIIWGQQDPILLWNEQSKSVLEDLNIDPINVHLLPMGKHFIQEDSTEKLIYLISEFA